MITGIRPTEHQDLQALAKFLIRVYQFAPSDHHADAQLLEWKYLSPRPGWEGHRSYLLEKDGEIAAHCGICPTTLNLPNGTTVSSVTMMDWAADPSAPGVGVRLFRKLMEVAPTSFVIGGSPATRAIVPRIGFRRVGEAVTYSAWLRPWLEFCTRPRSRRSTLRLLHGITHPARKREHESTVWDFAPVSEFDDSVLPVLNSSKHGWTFCRRTVADLNHVLGCPSVKTQGFLLRRHGQLAGYFIIGKAKWEARLFDLSVDSADSIDWNLACTAITQAAVLDPSVCRIRVQATFPVFSEALAWNGYWCQYKEPIVIHDPTKALDGAFPISFQLVDGDSGL